MSVAEETIKPKEAFKPKSAPLVNRSLDFLSSVRFGVVLLCTLVVLSMVGMLVMQQNVDGFDAYYVSLTPAERTVYGTLGIFDIYHSWYFNALLLVLSLNIILASIDHWEPMWKQFFSRPKLTATAGWLLNRREKAELDAEGDTATKASAIEKVFKEQGLKTRVTETADATFVFGERGRINRLGAYIVHVTLLTLFLGHFVALQTGFDATVRMFPGETTDQIQMIQFELDRKELYNVQLPFSIECTDIQQTLVDPRGGIDVTNTLDWRTQVRINDPEYGVTTADISLNKPFSYRGYRFFQAQTIPVGNARSITLDLIPQNGGEPVRLEIPRGGSAQMADGTKVDFQQFVPDFTFGPNGQPDTRSADYNNPAAVLAVTPPGGEAVRVFAFASKLADNIPVGAPKLGYKWRLADFEKSPTAHVLSIKYDPYNGAFIAWYFGGFGLIGALCFVFFLSHRRVWARIEKDSGRIVLAGDANRNHVAFHDKFEKIVEKLEALGLRRYGRSH
ncbi:MAG: cytochrome c biogenesis protein ResB [Pyrinomonadaceae bacterium]